MNSSFYYFVKYFLFPAHGFIVDIAGEKVLKKDGVFSLSHGNIAIVNQTTKELIGKNGICKPYKLSGVTKVYYADADFTVNVLTGAISLYDTVTTIYVDYSYCTVDVRDLYPEDELEVSDLPVVSLDIPEVDSKMFALGNDAQKYSVKFFADIFAGDKNSRSAIVDALIRGLSSGIPVYDFDSKVLIDSNGCVCSDFVFADNYLGCLGGPNKPSYSVFDNDKEEKVRHRGIVKGNYSYIG
jgi:hypothetical protein